MLSTLRAWLWGAPAPESAAPRPELHQFFPADEPRPTDARRWFEGSVLSVSPEGGTVSGDVWFEPAAVRGPRQPEVGERVRGEARRRDEEHAWLAIHVEVCDDDWGTAAEEAPAENRVVGQVRRFEGDVLVLADREDEYRLRQADAEVDFLPAEGDWLELESDDPIPREVTGGQKVRVRPLRRWEVDGEVTLVAHEQPMFGLVDNQIYFLPSAWSLARLPRRGDRVRCSAVESSQSTPRGLTLNWRAVRVAALEARAWLRPPPAAAPPPAASASFSADLLDDKQGVSVTGDGEFGQLKCGEQRRTTLVVRNASGAPVTLAAARLLSNAGGQFSVTPPDCAEIPAGGSAAVTVECRAELLGAARALCLLDFGAFRIGRWLGVIVEDPSAALLSAPAPSRRRARAAVGYDSDALDARQSCVVVPGQPAFKPAPFVSARLPPYPLPTRLLSMDGDRLLANYPCLASELGPDNYKQRLTLLLFIEEVEMLRQIRQFDMDGVVLGRAGEFLQLAVPGLAESRPSLVVGDKVLLSHPYEESGLKYEGYVHQVRHSALNIMFHPDFQQSYTGKEYNASFEFSRSQLRQLHRAVETALARLGAGVLFPTTATARLPQVNFVEEAGWSSERSVCSHTKRVSFDLDTDSQKMPPSPTGEEGAASGTASAPVEDTPSQSDSDVSFVSADGSVDESLSRTPSAGGSARRPRRTEKTGVRVLRFFNRGLNERQKSAVRRVLKGMARPLPYIIYGPPGTGKTVTMVECILQTYTMCPDSRLLVATPSNSAADLITERLHASGAVHRAALARLTSFNRSEDSCPEVVQPYVMSGDSLEAAARRRIVVGTAATLGNLYRLGLRQGHFTHVFVDEAGHMTEPETLVPLGLVSALDGQAVLAGDPRQLGPVLQSRYAAAWGLQTSMLERLSLRQLYGRDTEKFADHGCYNPLLVTKLVNNYRSHRELLTVPSRLFYDSELVPCVDAETANKWCRLPFLPRPGFPMLFHGVRGENIQEGDSPSWFNPTEAFQVIRYLQKLGSAGVDWDEVGVISPYRKQTEKIRELMTTFGLPTVKVGSVEEFQGQEREVIVLTTVRSSSVTLQHDVIYRLGFMQSPRRFNVAITRAKCLLIVIGNPELLAADEHWRHLVVHAVTNGAAIGCEGVL
ncbi:RNA helicase Mov10l1 [Amphibalanus amphitrite]|uniref:RNA helicase n=1 Tax=Amphibalanus amphitrite TaxID=1232801 RepID=A0A6A4W5R0_AMPAM|nr:RNA helicase Mov10l1 [Amphibalanus amphitrite]